MPDLFQFSATAMQVFAELKLPLAYIEELKRPVCLMIGNRVNKPDVPGAKRRLNAIADSARRLRAALNVVNSFSGQESPGALAGFVLEELMMHTEPECAEGVDIILDGRRVRAAIEWVSRLAKVAEEAAEDSLPVMVFVQGKGRPIARNYLPSIFDALERVWLSEQASPVTKKQRPLFLSLRHGDCEFRRIADACYEEAGSKGGVPEKAFEKFVSSKIAQRKQKLNSQ